MITLKSLNYEISSDLWNNFYINGYVNLNDKVGVSKTNLALVLDEAVKKEI